MITSVDGAGHRRGAGDAVSDLVYRGHGKDGTWLGAEPVTEPGHISARAAERGSRRICHLRSALPASRRCCRRPGEPNCGTESALACPLCCAR
jgi:hypothetical protein